MPYERPAFNGGSFPFCFFNACSFVDIWSNTGNMASCRATLYAATMAFDKTKCVSSQKTSAVSAKFWCQSLEIKEHGLLPAQLFSTDNQ